jgi:glycosyltransferase involved in cell wall biosynthesis
MAPRLSAFVITRNEAPRIGACLAAAAPVADELVVLDSGSDDGTADLARAAGARVEVRPFDGFGTQKQAALDLCRGDWVLSLDADEIVTPALAAAIGTAVSDPAAADGYAVRRELWYLGTRLRFGGTGGDWVLRLARRTRARFTPDPVHERLEVSGRTGRLAGPLAHHKYRRLAEHVAAMNRYTDLIAARKAAAGRRFRAWHLGRIPAELFLRLVLRGGVLDGRAGVVHAAMASFYGFLKYAKLWPDPADPAAPNAGPPR